MKHSDGFTLLELIVAIALTGVIALLVYGAAAVAVDTEERLRAQDLAIRTERAWRAVVVDALRNVRSTWDYNEPTFVLESGTDLFGRPSDRIILITAGCTPPLTPDADWKVTIEPTGTGLALVATPIGVASPAVVLLQLPGVTGLDVRVLVGREWLDEWSQTAASPRAIELTFWNDERPTGTPVRLTLPAVTAP